MEWYYIVLSTFGAIFIILIVIMLILWVTGSLEDYNTPCFIDERTLHSKDIIRDMKFDNEQIMKNVKILDEKNRELRREYNNYKNMFVLHKSLLTDEVKAITYKGEKYVLEPFEPYKVDEINFEKVLEELDCDFHTEQQSEKEFYEKKLAEIKYQENYSLCYDIENNKNDIIELFVLGKSIGRFTKEKAVKHAKTHLKQKEWVKVTKDAYECKKKS